MASSIRVDMRSLTRGLNDLAKRQVPFATAQMATSLGRRVQVAETAALRTTFDRPTPFTERAFGLITARKSNPVATVFAKDIQAVYLAPFGEEGSHQQLLRGRAIAKPVGQAVNQYGNLPRGKVKALLSRPDTFMGTVTLKSGSSISGVWRRPPTSRGRGKSARTGLKLLVRFTDPAPVRPRFEFEQIAMRTVNAHAKADWAAALAKAMATAR